MPLAQLIHDQPVFKGELVRGIEAVYFFFVLKVALMEAPNEGVALGVLERLTKSMSILHPISKGSLVIKNAEDSIRFLVTNV